MLHMAEGAPASSTEMVLDRLATLRHT